jgi:DNA invertase Pin-like site-specific DNA recombinase
MHKSGGIPLAEICTTLGVSRTTLYRDLNGAEGKKRKSAKRRRKPAS